MKNLERIGFALYLSEQSDGRGKSYTNNAQNSLRTWAGNNAKCNDNVSIMNSLLQWINSLIVA